MRTVCQVNGNRKKSFCSARRVMLFIFALPVMQVILFCLAIGRDPTGLKLAIVNHEMFYENMSCPVSEDCNFSHLSCRYLKFLDNETMIKVCSLT